MSLEFRKSKSYLNFLRICYSYFNFYKKNYAHIIFFIIIIILYALLLLLFCKSLHYNLYFLHDIIAVHVIYIKIELTQRRSGKKSIICHL